MKKVLLACMLASLVITAGAQPFRYIKNTPAERDSIKLLKIKGYRQYSAPHNKPEQKKLTGIVEYDRNGNLIRKWTLNAETGAQNQWTYKYDKDNKLQEFASYFPDSITVNQRIVHKYDRKGNEIEVINEFYNEGKLSRTNKTIKEYDPKGNCIDLKNVDEQGKVYNHYKYVYDDNGRKIEEITFYNNDKTSYSRKVEPHEYQEEQQPIGLPMDTDPDIAKLMYETTTYFPSGKWKLENGYDIRIFDKTNILLEWTEKNFRQHWFEYSFY
jgi:hypothetical protein